MRDASLNNAGGLDGVRPGKAAAPARRGRAPLKSAAGAARSKARVLRGRALATVASSAFAALMCGIVLNATVFQKGHHPAPLFGPAAEGAPPPPAARAAVPPQPLVRTVGTDAPATAPADLHPLPAAPAAAVKPSVPATAARPDRETVAHERAESPPAAARAKPGLPAATGGKVASSSTRTDRNRLAAMMAAAAGR